MIGHGQKGLVYTEGITWTRDCSVSDYCFQATTTDIKKVQKLIDYPWVMIIYVYIYIIYTHIYIYIYIYILL